MGRHMLSIQQARCSTPREHRFISRDREPRSPGDHPIPSKRLTSAVLANVLVAGGPCMIGVTGMNGGKCLQMNLKSCGQKSVKFTKLNV